MRGVANAFRTNSPALTAPAATACQEGSITVLIRGLEVGGGRGGTAATACHAPGLALPLSNHFATNELVKALARTIFSTKKIETFSVVRCVENAFRTNSPTLAAPAATACQG